jgi:hypothetical protein
MPKTDCCPRCGSELSLAETITLMNGSGYVRHILIELPDGSRIPMEARNVNPITMKIVTVDSACPEAERRYNAVR